jgi:lipoate-protein ligase A
MKQRELRLFLEPDTCGSENMRRDTSLLESCSDDTPVTLRLYTWSRPTISVGWMQDPAALLDLSACRDAGVDVVRRPTGGRAILHAQEITYAVAASLEDERFGSSVRESHAVIGACLAEALARLGVRTEVSRPTPDRERRMLRQPCFTSSGRHELLVCGRKLVGSAQRRSQRAFLQHGSLLIDRGHEQLVDFLLDAARDTCAARKLRRALRDATTTLRDELGRTPAFHELASVLAGAFASRLDLATAQSASPM